MTEKTFQLGKNLHIHCHRIQGSGRGSGSQQAAGNAQGGIGQGSTSPLLWKKRKKVSQTHCFNTDHPNHSHNPAPSPLNRGTFTIACAKSFGSQTQRSLALMGGTPAQGTGEPFKEPNGNRVDVPLPDGHWVGVTSSPIEQQTTCPWTPTKSRSS